MSADNWTYCPKCKKDNERKNAARLQEAQEAYGKIPAPDYLALVAAAEKPIPLEDTLREDYEIGINSDGVFRVSYSCSCHDCGFSFEFKREETPPC
jgi:hypothetical protein